MVAKPKPPPKPTYSDYGFVMAFLKAHPDVKRMVDQAVAHGWTQGKLENSIKTTKWWTTRTDAQRQYDVLSKENPKEIARRITLASTSISTLASQMGVTLSALQLKNLSTNSVINQASSGEIQSQVASFLQLAKQGGAQSGTSGTTVDQLRQGAAAYGISLDDNTLLKYTRAVEAGQSTTAGFQDAMREQAKTLYPSIGAQLDRGMTVKDITDPYTQIAQKELGISPASFDLTDPKWTKALTGATGGTMTADEWTSTLRTDPRYQWDQSPAAIQTAYSLGSNLRQMFQGA